MARLSVPTAGRLPSSLRVEASNPSVVKLLGRLSRESLLSLALDWLDEESVANSIPYLEEAETSEDEDSDDLYPPCRSLTELQELYMDMQLQKGSKRDVASRILEGDWRHGLTMYQLAMADLTYLDDHPTSQKWSAYQILPLRKPSKTGEDEQVLKVDKESLDIPRFHPATFLQQLQEQVLPDVKAHYQLYRPKSLPVLLLRIFIIESPYNSTLALAGTGSSDDPASFDSSKTIYLAFPDGAPSLYITKSQSTGVSNASETKSLQSLILDGVPKALSRPRQRYTLKPSNISSRNLGALLATRGPGRGNSAGGGWSIYVDEKQKGSPLDTVLPTPPLSREADKQDDSRKRRPPLNVRQRASKRSRLIAEARFGHSAIVSDGKGVEKIEVVLTDPFPHIEGGNGEQEDEDIESRGVEAATRRRSGIESVLKQAQDADDESEALLDGSHSSWAPTVKITFQGQHVFAGIRQLVEAGIVDGERMPGWMTGEDAVTTGVVRQGRIQSRAGSGL